jgi:osmotically-inducible protein OsmY
LPVLENGQLVGAVSRANLLQAVASALQLLDIAPTDKAIRDRILSNLKKQAWSHTGLLNVTVFNGIVDLWGVADSDAERKAIRVMAESSAGVGAVHDHLVTYRGGGWQ